ncbi:exosome complex component 10-like [Diadema antillarum]|uniref:exosome complex component 10-like n=1 Tax=Diadema antillarum TaxID=105358 RepID=UPI003A8C261F
MASLPSETASASTAATGNGRSDVEGGAGGSREEVFPGFSTVDDFAKKALGKLMLATRAANELPAGGDDYDFYSSYEGFRHFCNSQGDRLLRNIRQLAGQQGVKGSQIGISRTLELEDRMDALIETNDTLLESVGALLDEAAGVSKPHQTFPPDPVKPQLVVTSWNQKKADEKMQKSKNFRLMHAKNITRPQLKFRDKVDNSNTPFIPIISHKPNALKPLSEALELEKKSTEQDGAKPSKQDEETQTDLYPHPYQYELDHFEPDPTQLEPVENPSYLPLEATPLTLVNDSKTLGELLQDLKKVKEFAVDLEHHSYRSYQGFTCLMQISTADQDYIVDTLELRSDLHILNDVFTDPKIVKVLHGANMDILWLQRDLGLYVVNMFDTGQASRTLGFPHHGLATLLARYCQVEADKQYQLADWRIRPLPEEMLHYAREDTHYLLYIYHEMKNELIRRGNETSNLLRAVLDSSTRICLQRYEKPLFNSGSHIAALKKNRKVFNKKQLYAFKKLFAWRDSVARQEDESTGYVLPLHMMYQIAEILPKDQGGVLACCNPVPPLIKQNINEIHHFIMEARGMHAPKAKESEVFVSKTNTFSAPLLDPLDSLLHCPHDDVHDEGQRSLDKSKPGPPVTASSTSALLPEGTTPSHPPVSLATPTITLFDVPESDASQSEMTAAQKKVQAMKASFANPFEMYMLLSKPRQISPNILEADKITVNDKTKASQQSSSVQPLSVWIMKRATKRPKPEKEEPETYETRVVFNPDAAKKKKEENKKEEGPGRSSELPLPVRQMGGKQSKKRKHSDNPTGETPRPKKDRRGEHAERRGAEKHGRGEDKRHHRAESREQGDQWAESRGERDQWAESRGERGERRVTPYDYSQADYTVFQESRRSRGRGRGHRDQRGRGRGQFKVRVYLFVCLFILRI